MSQTTYTRHIADPPDWMDEEEFYVRQSITEEMIQLSQRGGRVPVVVGELLARYLEGDLDDAQLQAEFDKAYRSRCH